MKSIPLVWRNEFRLRFPTAWNIVVALFMGINTLSVSEQTTDLHLTINRQSLGLLKKRYTRTWNLLVVGKSSSQGRPHLSPHMSLNILTNSRPDFAGKALSPIPRKRTSEYAISAASLSYTVQGPDTSCTDPRCMLLQKFCWTTTQVLHRMYGRALSLCTSSCLPAASSSLPTEASRMKSWAQ